MSARSLQASPEGIEKARKALSGKALTQTALAEDKLTMVKISVSRSTIGKFFSGKSIDRQYFYEICERLGLEWDEIVLKPSEEEDLGKPLKIDTLVQQVREAIRDDIKERCGTMRILDMTHPIGLGEIYTHVNILEKILGRRRKAIPEMLEECNAADFFDRFGWGQIKEKRVPGLEAVAKHDKLMILGKPGAGKTTFSKHLAIQCNRGKFYPHLVPIFVTLKDFADAEKQPGLLDYIVGTFRHKALKTIIEQGRALILLDGLDEVREEDSQRVIKAIEGFSHRYRHNPFVITCRIAAREYTFDKFTEVEIADFDDTQIATFAGNWFKNKVVKPKTFLERLNENEPVKELASNPLLLTLLCIAFEESGEFPANRAELYKEGLDALLKKWDAKRGIQRYNPYGKLSLGRKEDLLSKIAWTTFERGDYFFKQRTAEQYITTYIRNLPGASLDEEALQLDSEKVLNSIEAQHGLLVARAKGIYSFSHLTFHEYFTAREVVTVRQSSEAALQGLVSHVADKRWREVFLLAVAMSPNADRLLLLMKEKIDGLVAEDERIQQWLTWGMEKARSVDVSYTPEDIKKTANQLGFAPKKELSLFLSLYLYFSRTLDLFLNLYRSLDFSLYHLSFSLDLFVSIYYLSPSVNLCLSRTLELSKKRDRALHHELQKLNDKLPKRKNEEELDQWWKANGKAWREQLRAVMVKYRNIGHDWQLSDEQRKLREQYWEANKFLMQCLNSECYVSREVRQEIEKTLFLPTRTVSYNAASVIP
ncbi:NACHT domain-containing NTPase [Lusitaniella coriacea LEGE 07157]|uniref:NACHT domain-containing NTPase n=2 Tax=Lusitaniella TaxID=1983104 RepID=A0A8J7AXU5_9CYAN|nr:NACHT domain-containing NTPase [Lusitaniella coriacea LEGE 07157]